MSKNLEIAALLDLYGPLLSEKQKNAIEEYYFDDFSLAEIGENCDISRQGVSELIKRAENFLQKAEDTLHLVKIKSESEEIILQIKSAVLSNDKDKALMLTDKLQQIIGG
ncbi:MAG: DNA-binding protein [Oscillospiraceae bacterium]|nr:DNA-binding protein [Candidatus Equicaccousia limihippi]